MNTELYLSRWIFLAFTLVGLLTLGGPPIVTAVTAADPISGCWTASTGAPLTSPEVTLNGIAALSPDDVWAVGSHTPPNSRSLTLVEHWDGQGWSIVASPSPGAFLNTLTAVAALSANDVWAVGSYGQAGTDSKTLILHWDGRSWTQVASPSVERTNQLTAITAISESDVWAVGFHSAGPDEQTLALHWDGASWTQVPTPNFSGPNGPEYSTLQGVAAPSSNNVWAVGRGGLNGALVVRWDGHSWTQVQLPSLDVSPNLLAVAVLGPDNVWATGGTFEHGTFAMHWDGKTWDTPPTPYPGDYPSSLNSLAPISPNNIWAVGTVGSSRMLVEHWDGSAWSIVSGTPDARGALTGSIAVTPATPAAPAAPNANGDLWIAGSAIDQRTELRQALIVRHTSTSCGPPAPLPPPVPLPGSGSRTFPETGKTVSGIFLNYWNMHGGLMQQGYPISDVMGEVSDLNGKSYTVQYFERAVFEDHPENQPPFNVLLSQLGTFEYRQKYPNGAPNQLPNSEPGSVLFQETGHRLGGRFLQYWRDNGGLIQQGYPISDEFTEVSPLNGQRYTVQYFERAVFEYHPENQPPYDVLLSQLGRFRYDAKYSAPPAQTPPPSPSSTPSPTAILLSDSVPYPGDDKPVGGGSYIFWTDTHTSPWAIMGYDVDAGRMFIVTQRPLLKGIIATDGKTLAWIERPPNGAPERILGYDIATGREFPIIGSTTERNFMSLAVDGSTLYYEEFTSGHGGVYARNISTGAEKLISDKGKRPVAGDGVLLWEEEVAHCSGDFCPYDWDLHILKSDGTTRIVANSGGENELSSYDVSGNNVVWGGTLEMPVVIYNVSTGSARSLSALAGTYPHIMGNTVAWTGAPSTAPGGESGFSVKAQDLAAGVVSTLVPDSDIGKRVQAVVGQNRKAVAFTTENVSTPSSSLYLIYIK